MSSVQDALRTLKRGTVEILPEEDLVKKLERAEKTGKKLKMKLGCDPSAPDLHLGHTVVLRKMREFQELGHEVIFVIGDFTARVGDPTGRSETRKPMSEEEVARNAETYFRQVYRLLKRESCKVVHNHDWLSKLTLQEILRLSSKFTVARTLERNDFAERFKGGQSIGVHEFLYPMMVAYDSVVLGADIELGGTDQTFNLLAGRELMSELGMEPQVCMTMPLLLGLDGVQKMSKSLGNYIAIEDPPQEMFGKAMSIPDRLILNYFELATGLDEAECRKIKAQLADPSTNPRDVKVRLGKEIVCLYHSHQEAEKAALDFDSIFKEKQVPEDMPVHVVGEPKVWIVKLMTSSGLAASSSEARRLIQQGAVELDGERVSDPEAQVELSRERILKVGKRRFLRVQA
jgi:tyrosyl-tRNA synthetase